MRKILYFFSVSLDGYIESPNGDPAWASPDEEMHYHLNKLEDGIDTHLYGRGMWELMAGFWPTAHKDPASTPAMVEYAAIWRSKAKVVFSRTLRDVDEGVTLIREVVPEEIRAMKDQPGGDISLGGASLAATFMAHDLIDEYHLALYPLLLGGGKPMFMPLGKHFDLRLIESRQFDRGVVFLRYERVRGN
ncbi:MAG: dihydrofolate reductase family protein [Dehalococcoidia bacterium]